MRYLVQQSAFLTLLLTAGVVVAATTPSTPTATTPEQLFQEAWYKENGLRDLGSAIDAYKSIVDQYPENEAVAAHALLRIAECYARLGDSLKANEAWRAAGIRYPDEIKKYPTRRRLIEQLCMEFDNALVSNEELGDMEFAREILEKIDISLASGICESFYQEALQQRKTSPTDAIRSLRKTVAIGGYLGLTKRAAAAQTIIGEIYTELREYDEALIAYRRALKDFPEEADLLAWTQIRIAEVYRLMRRPVDAIRAYEKVPKEFPEAIEQRAWALIWLGDLHRYRRDRLQARRAWREIVDEFGDSGPEVKLPVEVARYLLNNGTLPPDIVEESMFANDVAYFRAVRLETAYRYNEAQRYYDRCMEISVNRDWPYELVRQTQTGQPGF